MVGELYGSHQTHLEGGGSCFVQQTQRDSVCGAGKEWLIREMNLCSSHTHTHIHTHTQHHLAQLVSMDWQLGMTMSSSSCRSLHSPYLTLQLNVADPSGSLIQRTLQLTIAEFQVRGKPHTVCLMGGSCNMCLYVSTEFCWSTEGHG